MGVQYCTSTAHVGLNATSYSGLFCSLNKPICDRWLRCIHRVKGSGGRFFIAKIGHQREKNRGNFQFLFVVFRDVTLLLNTSYVTLQFHLVLHGIPSSAAQTATPKSSPGKTCYFIARLLCQTSISGTWLPVTSCLYTNKNTVPTRQKLVI